MDSMHRQWIAVARSGSLMASALTKIRQRDASSCIQNMKANWHAGKGSREFFLEWVGQDHSISELGALRRQNRDVTATLEAFASGAVFNTRDPGDELDDGREPRRRDDGPIQFQEDARAPPNIGPCPTHGRAAAPRPPRAAELLDFHIARREIHRSCRRRGEELGPARLLCCSREGKRVLH